MNTYMVELSNAEGRRSKREVRADSIEQVKEIVDLNVAADTDAYRVFGPVSLVWSEWMLPKAPVA